jgi:thiol-disulfide isomerase/thioredoxin
MEIIVFILLIILLLFHYLNEKFDDNKLLNKKIILYHTDWCGYCKRFIPTWEELKLDVELGNIVNFIDVNMTNEDKNITGDLNSDDLNIVNNVEIQGFPTIKLLHNGKIIDYNGKREKNDIIDFIKMQN